MKNRKMTFTSWNAGKSEDFEKEEKEVENQLANLKDDFVGTTLSFVLDDKTRPFLEGCINGLKEMLEKPDGTFVGFRAGHSKDDGGE